MHTLNHEQLKAAILTGGVTDITLRGDGAAFVVSVQTQGGEAVMVTSRKQPRRFADPRKALQLLRELGWHQCRINATDWHPETQAQEKVTRPDRSVALKAIHQAAQADADYDRWFHTKVQASMDGLADGTNWVLIADEDRARRAALRAKLLTMRPVQIP